MKIAQSKVNLTPAPGLPRIDAKLPKVNLPKVNLPKVNTPKAESAKAFLPMDVAAPVKKAAKHPVRPLPPGSGFNDDYSGLKDVAATMERIRIGAMQELNQIRRIRGDAIRYQQETGTKARSEAHQLVLHARLETQKEIEELIREASEEIQKVLADIRVIRITAQEELAAQRKFTDAAKIGAMSISIKEELAHKKKKVLAGTKA